MYRIIKNTIFVDILIIFLTLIYFFKPVFLDNKILAPADFIFNWTPWSSIKPVNYTGPSNPIISDVADGWLPRMEEVAHTPFFKLFNDYNFTSGWGRPNPSIVGGGTQDLLLIFSVKALGVPYGITFYYIIIKTFLTGIGMYFLLNHFKLSRISKLFGAISYMYASPFIAALLFPHTIINTLLPFLILIVDSFFNGLTTKKILAYILVVYCMFSFSSFPALIFYGGLISAVYFLYKLLIEYKENTKNKSILVLKYITINLITFLIISFTILPNLTTFNSMDLGYRQNYGLRRLAPDHFLQLFYPNICGNHINIPWTCDSNWNETSTFSGILPIIFILLTIFIGKNIHNKKKWFFLTITILEILIIFNFFNILRIISHIPLLNLNPSTRLVVILPFTLIIGSCFALEQLIKSKLKIKKLLLQISLLIVIIFVLLKWITLNVYPLFIEKLSEIPKVFIDNDIHLYLKLCLIIAFILINYLIFKKHKTKELILIILCLIPLFELKHFNGYYNPYISKNNFYPTTPGIEFLQKNLKTQDRILTMERVFLPNVPNYYHINTITGHDFRTKEFTQNMQYLDPNIFKGHGTYGFFDRTSTKLGLDMRNFMIFNRIKYLAFGSSALSPRFNIIDQQINYNKVLIMDKDYQYIYKPLSETRINGMMLNIVESNKNCQIIKNLQIKNSNTRPITIPIINTLCENGAVKISFKETALPIDSNLIINFNKDPSNKIYIYNAIDIFENGYFSDSINKYSDISFYFYKDTGSEPYKKVYSGNDLALYEINQNTSTAFFYPCNNIDENQCKSILLNTKLEDINNIFNKLTPIEFDSYSNGKITINTNKINSPGIIIFSDSYFDGWKSTNKNIEIFKGLYGSLNIYIKNNTENNVSLFYFDPYLKLGLLLSVCGLSGLFVFLRFSSKSKK